MATMNVSADAYEITRFPHNVQLMVSRVVARNAERTCRVNHVEALRGIAASRGQGH